MKITGILFFIILAFSAISCNKNPSDLAPEKLELPPDTAGPAISFDSYKISVGNRWEYNDHSVFTAIADTVINGVQTVKVVGASSYKQSQVYYANSADGLHAVAYGFDSSNNIGPCLMPLISFKNKPFVLLDPGVFILKLPTTIDESWSSNDFDLESPSGFTRKWMGYVTVTTPAGTFNCIKLYCSSNLGLSAYQYWCEKGLVKSVQIITSNGPGGSSYNVKTSILTSVNF